MNNHIVSRLLDMLGVLVTDRKFCMLVFAQALIPFGLYWTVYHQVTGTIPQSETINLFWLYKIHLPFGVSRLWDLFLVPALYLVIYSYLATSRFWMDQYEELNDDGELILKCVTAICLVTMVVGITNLLISLILGPVILVLYAICLMIEYNLHKSFISNWRKEAQQ